MKSIQFLLIIPFLYFAPTNTSAGETKYIDKSPQINKSTSRLSINKIIKKKTYKIPGATAISYAKKHGYSFTVSMNSAPRGCKFKGMHWEIPAGTYCNIIGFQSRVKRCEKLRKGWMLKKITFKGGVTGRWKRWPKNTSYPNLDMSPSNSAPNAKKTRMFQIDQLTLVGPEGEFNKFEEAFSHCSDPRYQP